jgi:DNA-binding transcriptional regulator/RsmH inhibitor MraZ
MSMLDKQVGYARRRLTSNILLQRLSLGVLLAGAGWTLAIIVVRLFALPVALGYGAGVAAGAALLFALVGTGLSRPSPLRAAMALDSAAGLKERLSTALALRGAPDPFVVAAVADAEKTAGRVHVPAHIRHRAPAVWPWSAAMVVVPLILLRFMPAVDLLAGQRESGPTVPRAVVAAEHQTIKIELDEKLNELKELAKENPDLRDLTEDLQPLDMPDTPGVTPEDVRRNAVKRIDAVAEKLERQLQAAGENPVTEMKRRLGKLEAEGGDQAAAELSRALATGDFQGARQVLDKMSAQIREAADQADDPESQRRLAELQEQLTRLADQVGKLSDTVQLQKELENKGGLSPEQAQKLLEALGQMDPKQLEKELQKQLGGRGLTPQQIEQLAQKIRQNQQAQKACRQLSDSLSKAAQACQQCNSPGGASSGSASAANALSDAMSQLSDLEMSEQLANELQAHLSDLETLRDDVCQGRCQGDYPGCRRDGRIGPQGSRAGLGLGSLIGKEKAGYQTDPTKAKSRYQDGAIIGQMLIDGPQVRGEASAAALSAAAAEVRDALDAIEREEVPRQYRKVLQEYFERLAGLVQARQEGEQAAAEAAPE